MVYHHIIAFLFGMGLLVNAVLFIPQAWRIWREKSAHGVSLVTFVGFLLIQLVTVLHAFGMGDYELMYGFLLSMLTCGSVAVLATYFRYIRGQDAACEHSKNKDPELTGIANELSLAALIEQMPGHIYWKDKEGRRLGCNRENWQQFGLSSLEDYKNKFDHEIFREEEARFITGVDREVLTTGETRYAEEASSLANGEQALFLSKKSPLRNKQGKIVGVAGVSLDITETRNEQIAKLKFFENMIAYMPGHVYWVNRDGVYEGCNNEQARSAGLSSRHEIVGMRNRDLPWKNNRSVLAEKLDRTNQEVMQTGRTLVLEEQSEALDGRRLVYLSTKVPLRNGSNQVVGMLGYSLDITEIKRSEIAYHEAKQQAESASHAKNDFLANMRHDLRTPFSGILSLAEIMQEQETAADKRENLNLIVQSAKQLLSHLNEILEFAKSEDGGLPILDKPIAIKKLLEDIKNMMLPAAHAKKLVFKMTIDSAVPGIVIGDLIRTQRILINLLSNAIKFTQCGGVELIVKVEKNLDSGFVLKFVVIDTGIGIPEDKYNLIFERFNRLTSSYSGVYPGNGLGLRMVKRFLDEVNGQSMVRSRMGEGSTFTVLIPYRASLAELSQDQAAVDTSLSV